MVEEVEEETTVIQEVAVVEEAVMEAVEEETTEIQEVAVVEEATRVTEEVVMDSDPEDVEEAVAVMTIKDK